VRAYRHFGSALIHGGIYGDGATGAVNTPIYQTSTFMQEGLGKHKGYEYSRTGNPTRAALESLIAELEGGAAGFAFASGMAAVTAVLALFNAGERVIVTSNVYGGTYRVLDKIFRRFGLTYTLADTSDLAALEDAITSDVRAVMVESPANPLLTVTDIAAVSRLCKRRGLCLIVDNTFMTPYFQRPIELGADIALHSATKYLGGHSDIIAGLVAARDAELAERLHFIQNATGGILQPFDSFLLIRSIKTLGVRMERHAENAVAAVDFLRAHRAVDKVYYPGLPQAPGYEINKRQAGCGGAMIAFELAADRALRVFFESLRLVALAESLGGVESLVCHPASMTHASMPEEIREKVGISDRLVRLSVGIEDIRDILDDIGQALDRSGVSAS
jgi:cystathionine beta-lyase